MYWLTFFGTRYWVSNPFVNRSRSSVAEIRTSGMSTETKSKGTESFCPTRLTATIVTSLTNASHSCQLGIPLSASEPTIQKSSSLGFSRFHSRTVSTAYVGPLRAISTSLT